MIIKQMLGIRWVNNKDGAAYYEDENGNDWYEFRNSLADDKPIIVVASDTRTVLMYLIGDPTFVGLFTDKIVDVYQLDQFPAKSINDFLSRSFAFGKDGKVSEIIQPIKLQLRTKEDIAADLRKLQEELAGM